MKKDSSSKTELNLILVDPQDAHFLSEYKWYLNAQGYVARCEKRKYISLHRTILGLSDRHVYVDHINGNRLDNRRANLRTCSHAENLRNRGKPTSNTSGFKGVSFHKRSGKWRADIKVDYKAVWLGLYDTSLQAHEAYKEAAARLHGGFARTEPLHGR
jgi:hypothetical protein